ncbi:MAG: hypothetical protein ACI4WM_10200 [Erysipelotrichaceae bacterium]
MDEEKKPYVAYEYKEITVKNEELYMQIDGYECFGWKVEDIVENNKSHSSVRMKRDRKIINKVELTRLQNHFEACLNEIAALEESKTRRATIVSLIVGVIGTAFMAGSTFAIVHNPPMIVWCIILAIPGFTGWLLPYFIYKKLLEEDTNRMNQLIEDKKEEMFEICEKGHSLL